MRNTQLTIFQGINQNEAPEGFYPIPKDHATTSNICYSCDAKPLCQTNVNDWCKNNPCMSYRRIDEMPVLFKNKP